MRLAKRQKKKNPFFSLHNKVSLYLPRFSGVEVPYLFLKERTSQFLYLPFR
jgi:hypothetical protein